MLTIIDADSLLYYSSKDTIVESVSEIENRLETILNRTNADKFIICISSSNYYRKEVEPEYKAKRLPTTLKYVQTLKQYLFETYKVLSISKLEADDLMGILPTKATLIDQEITISSPDKDVLKQLPGKHYDYYKDEFVKTTTTEGIDFLFTQLITGDSTDGIKGIPGKGPAFAKKVIKPGKLEENLMNTFKAYIDHYGNIPLGIKKFYTNFIQVYILRSQSDITEFIDLTSEINWEEFDLNLFINPYTKTKKEW